MKFQNEELVCR